MRLHADDMNRIRELRDQQKLSSYRLAELVGTTQPTIQRLETGKRKLTVDWMQRIARALGVMPHELLAPVFLEETESDVAPYAPDDAHAAAALRSADRQLFRVMTDAVSYAGPRPGDVVSVDISEGVIDRAKTGDICVAIVIDARTLQKRHILRQYLAPSLLTTNSITKNSLPIDMRRADVEIVGVVQN